jgi:hypothetical protein
VAAFDLTSVAAQPGPSQLDESRPEHRQDMVHKEGRHAFK